MASIVIRSVIIYVLLTVFLRIMGKRQIGELDVSELVSTLLISEIAAIPIDDSDIPLMNAIIPSLLILSLEIIVSTLKNKSERLKRAFEGRSSYIIYKGRLFQKSLDENRLSINEVLAEMRCQGIGDIGEIEYAVIESNGKLSFIKKDDTVMAHAVLIDGQELSADLKRLGYNETWLKKRLDEAGVRRDEVFLMTVNDEGEVNVIRRDEKK